MNLTEPVKARHIMIEALCAHPNSIKDIANQLGVSYHTIRNDVEFLQGQTRLRASGTFKDKAACYETGKASQLPELVNSKTRQRATIIDAVKSMLSKKLAPTNASHAADNFSVHVLAWLRFCANLKDGMTIELTDVIALRERMLKDYDSVKLITSYYDQFLGGNFWSIEAIARVTMSDEISSSEIESFIQQYTELLQQKNATAQVNEATETTEG